MYLPLLPLVYQVSEDMQAKESALASLGTNAGANQDIVGCQLIAP